MNGTSRRHLKQSTAGDRISSDHVGSHAHLTNSIHMHRHSPIRAEHESLMRDLLALQRSRSLRDPSTSPRSWISPNRRSICETDETARKSRKSFKDDHKSNNVAGLKSLLEQLEEAPRRKSRYKRGRRRPVNLKGSKAQIGNKTLNPSLVDHGEMYKKSQVREEEPEGEDVEMEVTQCSRNVCGIPWNWSRIHNRGKSFLDIAGKSFSCGISDSRVRDESHAQEIHKNGSNLDLVSSPTISGSGSLSESESLPLLVEASGNDSYSDVGSQMRSVSSRQHRSLTEKYSPKTFKDIVGQGLVVQALSNSVSRRKIGSVYLFYGPHGTGKSSCARVFAKSLNCQSTDHAKPCDLCTTCMSHNLGRSKYLIELGPVGNLDNFERIMDSLNKGVSRYKFLIIDECNILPPNIWSVISRAIDRAPRNVVFILISGNLDLPHVVISRCQKFFFPKIKESDIVNTLQWISMSEGLEIDREALKLIASRSDGSLRDAEMTLEQLSLLGQRISVSLVQELVGLVSDEKLVELLDLALSADTVNTVKRLRQLIETGVEPLALMSQLATIITDILAGSFSFTLERRRKFFRRPTLSKEDMEKLRKALKTLSEAEKQLRLTNDKLTWLTAALLQLAPDQNYTLQSSSTGTPSLDHSQRVFWEHSTGRRGNDEIAPEGLGYASKGRVDNERIWRAVLENVLSDSLRRFLNEHAKLNSVSLGEAPTVQLTFNSNTNKSKAEKFRGQILQAFESALSCMVILEIRYESKKEIKEIGLNPLDFGLSENNGHMTLRRSLTNHRPLYSGNRIGNGNFLRGIGPHILTEGEVINSGFRDINRMRKKGVWIGEGSTSYKQENLINSLEKRGKIGEGSRRKGVSIAERLERENLRLEPSSRRLCCWNVSRSTTRQKLSKLRFRGRRPRSFIKHVMFGRCMNARSSPKVKI